MEEGELYCVAFSIEWALLLHNIARTLFKANKKTARGSSGRAVAEAGGARQVDTWLNLLHTGIRL